MPFSVRMYIFQQYLKLDRKIDFKKDNPSDSAL